MAFKHTGKIDPNRCMAAVSDGERWPTYHQCTRKPWRDGWCRTHHPETAAARDAKRRIAWNKEWADDAARHRLQNAAPQLLEACQQALAHLDIECDGLTRIGRCASPRLDDARKILAAAIAEATGDKPQTER